MTGACFDTSHAVAAFTGVPLTRPRYDVVEEVLRERHAQEVRWGEQNHPDGTSWSQHAGHREAARVVCDTKHEDGRGTWLDILLEEAYEAAAEEDVAKLRTELIQVAAVAVAWAEAIDRRTT